MLDPPAFMPTLGISMSPVDHPAFGIPVVLAMKLDAVPDFQIFNASCQIDIVGNEYRLAGTGAENEPLMSASVMIVRQDFDDLSIPPDLKIAALVLKRGPQRRISIAPDRWSDRVRIWKFAVLTTADEGDDEGDDEESYDER